MAKSPRTTTAIETTNVGALLLQQIALKEAAHIETLRREAQEKLDAEMASYEAAALARLAKEAAAEDAVAEKVAAVVVVAVPSLEERLGAAKLAVSEAVAETVAAAKALSAIGKKDRKGYAVAEVALKEAHDLLARMRAVREQVVAEMQPVIETPTEVVVGEQPKVALGSKERPFAIRREAGKSFYCVVEEAKVAVKATATPAKMAKPVQKVEVTYMNGKMVAQSAAFVAKLKSYGKKEGRDYVLVATYKTDAALAVCQKANANVAKAKAVVSAPVVVVSVDAEIASLEAQIAAAKAAKVAKLQAELAILLG